MQLISLFRPILISIFKCHLFFNKWGKDYLLAIFFFLVGGTIAKIFYQKIGYTFFYQNFVPEAILWACGHEFLFPKNTITELIPFLKGEVLSFDCNTLPLLDLHNTTSEFAGVQPYLTWSVALLWKLFGVNYQALSLLMFALWGAYTSGIYLLIKQLCDKWGAILATLFICLSPVMIHMIGNLRDFSKAPFIIWALFFLIRTIKNPAKTGLKDFIWPVLAGATAGLGMGFRSDLFFLLPIGSIFLVIGFYDPRIKTITGQIISRAKIGIIFAATFIIFASPILKNGGPGGVGGVFIMQGMSEPFRKNLMLDPASYTTGWSYSDELTLSSIAASERQKDSEKWDEKERAGIPGISISQAMHLGTSNLFQWADLFIGDFANQAIKSFTWIIGFPLYIANSNFTPHNPYLGLSPQFITYSVYKKLGSWVYLALPLIGFLIVLFKSYLRSMSECIALAFLIVFLGAYSAIQFQFRHFFYLEFIWIVCFIFSISHAHLLWNHKKHFFKFSISMALLIFITTIAYFCIVRYQKFALSTELQALMIHPRDAITIQKSVSKDGTTALSVPVPSEYLRLIQSPPDSMTPAMEFIGSEWDIRSAAARYLLSINGLGCNIDDVAITFNYNHTNSTWQPLDHTYISKARKSGLERSVIFTGFYRPTQYFKSISIPSHLKDCELKLERISANTRLPYVFTSDVSIRDVMIPNIKRLGKYYQ
jgi:hypothetical protein